GRNDIYNSVGSISVASEEQLQGAGTAYPDWVAERYLQLPSDLPERVREEARQVVAGTTSSYDQAVAIEDYLRQLPFDLSVEAAPPGRDVVDFLLFDLQAGYFDYQASAMAVMLRSLGIPARIAVGYVLDPEDEIQSRYTVRKDDAYAWVEVFFPEYGWINFNPTRDRPAGGAGELSSFFSDEEIILIDPESLIPTDEELLGNPFINEALLEPPDLADEGFTVPWTLIFIVAGVLAVLAATTLSGRIAWNWGLSGLDGRAAMWEKVQRLARFTGFRSRPSETPQEWASRLGSGVGHEDEAANLSAAYEESRYGRPDLVRVDEGVAEESYRSLRNTLTKMLLRRGQKPPAEDPDRP
ncbi:MAG TPA: transglutaminase domain-containing protein, partial [Dehalococcoidia bacterium]|nr:transglutaminase domain-containing protein [Dehalococcoidia bacterium]